MKEVFYIGQSRFLGITLSLCFLLMLSNALYAQNNLNEEVFSFLRGSKWKIIKCDCGFPIMDKAFLLNYSVFNDLNYQFYSSNGSIIINHSVTISNVKRLSNGLLSFTFKLPLSKTEQKTLGRVTDIHNYKVIDNNTIEADIQGCQQLLKRTK